MDFALTDEQRMFKDQVLKFARREIAPRAQEHDLKGQFDYESWKKLGEFGILGLHFPEELGGGGADVVTTVLAAEALGEAGVDGGLTLSYGAHTFLAADTIFTYGTDAQRQKYIPGPGLPAKKSDAWASPNRARARTWPLCGLERNARATPGCSTAPRCSSPMALLQTWQSSMRRPTQQQDTREFQPSSWKKGLPVFP